MAESTSASDFAPGPVSGATAGRPAMADSDQAEHDVDPPTREKPKLILVCLVGNVVLSGLTAGFVVVEAELFGVALDTENIGLVGATFIVWLGLLGYSQWMFNSLSTPISYSHWDFTAHRPAAFRSSLKIVCALLLLWAACGAFSLSFVLEVLLPLLDYETTDGTCIEDYRAGSILLCAVLGGSLLVTLCCSLVTARGLLHQDSGKIHHEAQIASSPLVQVGSARASQRSEMLSEGKHHRRSRRHTQRELGVDHRRKHRHTPRDFDSDSSSSSSQAESSSSSTSSSTGSSDTYHFQGHSHHKRLSRPTTRWDMFKDRIEGRSPREHKRHALHKHVRIDSEGNKWVTTLVGGQRTTIEIPASRAERKKRREEKRREEHRGHRHRDEDEDESSSSSGSSEGERKERRHQQTRREHKNAQMNKTSQALENSTESGLVMGSI